MVAPTTEAVQGNSSHCAEVSQGVEADGPTACTRYTYP